MFTRGQFVYDLGEKEHAEAVRGESQGLVLAKKG